MPKRTAIGVVTSDKMQKTRRVEIPRLVQHNVYGKIIRRRTICYAHDENNDSSLGDTVEIMESRPRSKSKRWELVRVVEKRRDIDVAAMKAARDSAERDAQMVDVSAGSEKTTSE
jgi:small subunit ribosomal protein S17